MNETVTFWAELWWPMEKNSHGESLTSPKFGTEPECVSWVRARRTQERCGTTPEVGMFKRVSQEGRDYEDVPLFTEDAPAPDPARLHQLVLELKDMLTEKSHDVRVKNKFL